MSARGNNDYIYNIPIYKSPIHKEKPIAYNTIVHTAVDKVPTSNLSIDYEDDIWDFNSLFKTPLKSAYKIDYSDAPSEIKDCLKFFFIYKMESGLKIPSIIQRCSFFIKTIDRILRNKPISRFCLVTTQDIIEEIDGRNAGAQQNYALYLSMYQIYRFLEYYFKKYYPVDIGVLKDYAEANKKKKDLQGEKLPNIPDELFNAIKKKAIEIMRDSSFPHNDRVTAASVVVLSQTGFRLGELLILTVDRIYEKKLFKSGFSTHFIRYQSRKSSKDDGELLEFDIFCNELCFEAITILKDLRTIIQQKDNVGDWLIVYDKSPYKDAPELPISLHYFRQKYYYFLYTYLRDYVSHEWEGIKRVCVHYYDREKHKKNKANIYAPDTRQYRVRVCTELYKRNVPLVYIQRFMGHLTESMLGYYVRAEDHSQENAEYTAKLVREIENENLVLLGHEEGNYIVNAIKDFIKKGNYNVDIDMDRIISNLGDTLVVRGKEGGVCIKSSTLPCSMDARTNEVLCSAGVCPNYYHVYYMIDITICDFELLQQAYLNAIRAGKKAQANKEQNKLYYLVKNRLIPELDELEKQIKCNGINQVIALHPELESIIKQRETIRKEADKYRHNYKNHI